MGGNKTQEKLRMGAAQVEALLNPKNVVIIGATDKPGNLAPTCVAQSVALWL